MNLEDLRKQIDDVDAKIVELIGERVKIVKEIGKGKKAQNQLIENREREKKVLERVRSIALEKNLRTEDVESIYQRIIAASKHIQGVEVAFQGELGAYSEEAASLFFGPTIQTRPRETLEEVFELVEQEDVAFGIVPVENSLEGIISRSYDLLLESSLKVCGEKELRVIHCLIGSPQAGMDSIRRIFSHPQALGQCQKG